MKNTKYFIALFFFLLLISCDKKEDPSTRKLLVDKSWVISKLELEVLNIKYDLTTVYSTAEGTCYMDNERIFYTNGDFEENEGDSLCLQGSSQIIATGTWSLSSDEKILAFPIFGIAPVSFTIESISNSTIVLSTEADIFDLAQYTTIPGLTLELKTYFTLKVK